MTLSLLTASLLGYLLGSVPFGMILTRVAGYGDIRSIGSGNIGATNVLRTGNKKLAALTLLLDGAKGAGAVVIVRALFPYLPDCRWTSCAANAPSCCAVPGSSDFVLLLPLIAAFCALLGHMFPFWLKFKGGKGVATALGVLLALSPPTGVAAMATWGITAAFTRISSLSALVAVSLSPFFAWVLDSDPALPLFCLFSALLVIFRHRANIARLLTGQEPRIGEKKKASAG